MTFQKTMDNMIIREETYLYTLKNEYIPGDDALGAFT